MTDPEDPGGSRSPITLTDEQEIAVDGERLRRLAGRALDLLGITPLARLDLSLVTVDRIAELKEHAFGARAATDVLSFPMDDPSAPAPGPLVLGDIVICPEVAVRHARALGRAVDDELAQLLVHGLLHLLGDDHADAASESAMFRRERALLRELGAAA